MNSLQAIGRDWTEETGEPIPTSIEEWQRLAVRAGISPDKLWTGDWTIRRIAPYILGYLDRLRDGDRPQATSDPCKHSPDFRSVRWHGHDYSFTRNQALCVKELWAAWEAGTPERDGVSVVTEADVSQARLVDVFKRKSGMHPAWGALIVPGATKGSYRLSDGPSIAKKPRQKVPRKTPRKTPR